MRKSVCQVSNLFGHKQPSTATKVGLGLEALKFQIYKEEGLYYLCSKNKGVDQMHGYGTADLRFCFHIII